MNSFVAYDPVIDLTGLKPGEIQENVKPISSSIAPPESQDIDNLKENEGRQESEGKDDLAEKTYHPQAVTDQQGRTSTGDPEWDELIDLIIPPKAEKKPKKKEAKPAKTLEEIYDCDEDDEKFYGSFDSSDEESISESEYDRIDYEKLKWVQFVSKVQITRVELENLHNRLNAQLEYRRARLKGLCHVRHDIYDELFTEILRQVLINMPERGILLSKVQNEANMKLEAYEMLVSRTFSYGVKKLTEASHGLKDLETEVKELEEKDSSLTDSVKEIEGKIEYHKKDIILQKEAHQFARDKELEYLRHYQDNLSRFIKSITEEED